MRRKAPLLTVFGIISTFGLAAQTRPDSVPLYRVTVVERTVKAVNYQYRSGPTEIDFRGTVLLPDSKGGATVESKAGRIEIDAHFEHVAPPTRFGREYLTYVLWAITPEGNAKNLGEVLAGSSDKAKTHVTTELQAFGMLVTAEPYSAVRQPSDVVVMENQVRPDTVGGVEPIQAKYDLMPRGAYTYNVPSDMEAANGNGPKVSQGEYETLVEVYQAQNAVQIARAMGADQLAGETFDKADQLLRKAQGLQAAKADKSQVITAAREAAQTAEDARTIATKRKQEGDLASARAQVAQEQELRMKAEAEAQRAQSQASAARAQLDSERVARQQADAQAVAAADRVQQQPPVYAAPPSTPEYSATTTPPAPPARTDDGKRELRVNLYRQLSGAMPSRDTPTGLVVTATDAEFHGTALDSAVAAHVAQVAEAVAACPGLRVEVDGFSDTSAGDRQANDRAMAVRDALLRGGLPASLVVARGLGSSKPLGPNRTAQDRTQNRRVEIVISGDVIGSVPYWDKTYSVMPK